VQALGKRCCQILVLAPFIMDPNTTEIERAFQLAESGRFTSVELIRHQLKAEGYSTAHVTGKSLTNQLAAIMRSNAGNSPRG
jgi:hypothetical protein